MPDRLKVGVAQLATEGSLERNLTKIIRFVREAAARGCRVLAFPECALYAGPDVPKAHIDAAVEKVREATANLGIYVVLGLCHRLTDGAPLHNRLVVLRPDGNVEQSYDKAWFDPRFAPMPGPFMIDDIVCCAIICADRWIRAVEELPVSRGAQIIFETSNNYSNEWIPDLGWYWYAPRAMRNGAYVVFANSSRERPALEPEHGPGHGHSAVFAPDGTLVVGAGEEADRLLVATLELSEATRAEAVRRHKHPLFASFWNTGLAMMGGATVEAPIFEPLIAPAATVTVAAAQIACSGSAEANLERMRRWLEEAKERSVDVVAFPELAVTAATEAGIAAVDKAMLEAALCQVQEMACAARLCVVFGMPRASEGGARHNSAYVIGPAGELLTCHDQLVVDRPHLFVAGSSTKAMWFEVKGVPAVVTVGYEGLWSEIAELAGVRGALLHIHLAHSSDGSAAGRLRLRQIWANLASFGTLTVTVNAASPACGGSTIWQDYNRACSGRAGGFAPHSAVRLAQAGDHEALLTATQVTPSRNPHFGRMMGATNARLEAWYAAGARAVYAD